MTYHHVTDEFLTSHEIGEFMELPLWLKLPDAEQFMTFNIDKAINDGLVFRPLADTIRHTYQWAKDLPDDTPKPANLPVEKEDMLLKALGE